MTGVFPAVGECFDTPDDLFVAFGHCGAHGIAHASHCFLEFGGNLAGNVDCARQHAFVSVDGGCCPEFMACCFGSVKSLFACHVCAHPFRCVFCAGHERVACFVSQITPFGVGEFAVP